MIYYTAHERFVWIPVRNVSSYRKKKKKHHIDTRQRPSPKHADSVELDYRTPSGRTCRASNLDIRSPGDSGQRLTPIRSSPLRVPSFNDSVFLLISLASHSRYPFRLSLSLLLSLLFFFSYTIQTRSSRPLDIGRRGRYTPAHQTPPRVSCPSVSIVHRR